MEDIIETRQIIRDDRSIKEFVSKFDDDLAEIIQNFETSEKAFESAYRDVANSTTWVREYLFLCLESQISGVRLLTEGFVNAAGNTFRISYEALAMCILLTARTKVKVGRGKQVKFIDFHEAYCSGDRAASPYQAIDTVANNAKNIGLEQGSNWLKQAKDFYNGYSHASHITFSSLVLKNGQSIVGGGYNSGKDDIYNSHLQFAKRFSIQLPNLITSVAKRDLTKPVKSPT